jgi:glycosyltransferase involved in cell wall biosynthesis
MPVFNGLKTLDRAIGSVVRQTFPGWELLVVDDCSTDGTSDALKRWAARDSRVRPLRTSQNGGPAAARNVGLKHARGERIAYLDCDDEYYADYLQEVARLHQPSDVLVFGYDLVHHDGQPDCRVETWEPARERGKLFTVNIVTALGVSHQREWVERIGGFDERLWRETDWDYWKRLARARARFMYLPEKSGRYYVRRASQSRSPHVTVRQREGAIRNWGAGRPLFWDASCGRRRGKVARVAFRSSYCLIDFTSGAAVATMRLLRVLLDRGFQCRAFCGPWLDQGDAFAPERSLAQFGPELEIQESTTAGLNAQLVSASHLGVPVTVFSSPAAKGRWPSREEADAFVEGYRAFLDSYRPEVLITYGGDPASRKLALMAKSRDIPIVFLLHNFSYRHRGVFRATDYVVVPSDFSRQYHWERVGLACQVLPNVVDWQRVHVANRDPRYVTFVNPHMVKGVYVFARIAEQLARRRPDIPLLVVEGRRTTETLTQTGIDLSGVRELRCMKNTPDPRDFYRVTKLLLMPSLWNESFGLVAAEAMVSGIPVLASNRGSLPEIVGDAGVLLDIPAWYTPATRAAPRPEEVEPWVETICRLWDDEQAYGDLSERAQQRARQWHVDNLSPTYGEFFRELHPQPGPPLLPRRFWA